MSAAWRLIAGSMHVRSKALLAVVPNARHRLARLAPQTYNTAIMAPSSHLSSFPAALLAIACVALSGSALAQAPATSAPPASEATPGKDLQGTDGRHNQKIERIHIDDGGTKVDELRVGGETKGITVTPKGNMPQYEVQPTNPSRTNAQGQGEAGSGGTGPALWNVLKF